MHHANPAGSPERGRNKEASSLPAPLMLPAQQSALLSLINSPATLESLGAKKERARVEEAASPAHGVLRHVLRCQEWKAWFALSLFDQKAQHGTLPQCLLCKLLGAVVNKHEAWYGFLAKRLHSNSNEAADMSQEREISRRRGAQGAWASQACEMALYPETLTESPETDCKPSPYTAPPARAICKAACKSS